tara:strand:- start:63 stop:1250 length:1188 start_codon:yes stop_codon:yes gene_type:complete
MPKLTQTDTWVREYRDLLRQSMEEHHQWSVGEHNGSIRLQVKDNGKKQTRLLPFEWSKKGFSAAIPEIQQIYKRFYDGNTRQLTRACEEVKVSGDSQVEFSDLIKEFRNFVPNASDQTWNKSYLPVLYKAKELLDRKKHKPVDGEDLMMKALEQWEQGSRQRQIQRRSLNKFLNWAVLRAKLPNCYAPPAIVPEVRKPKKVGYAFSDQQIISLIEGETDEQWKFAYQLMAVYGLRPEELRHLRIMEGTAGKELWSIYRKSKGGNKGERTEPRRLNPLFVKDIDGKPINWKLQQRLEIGEKLPPLGQEGAAGMAILTHIKRRSIYKQIKDEALLIGQHAVPYSFRHRYSKESHANGIPIANIAASMGHSVEVHLDNYSRFAPDGTVDIYAKANQLV